MVRECERAVRRHDQDSPYMSFAAVLAKEYIEKFVYALQLRAGSRLETLRRPARARPIHIPENLAKKRGSGEEKAE